MKRLNRFDLTGRVIVITGGAGLLGVEHAHAVLEQGGLPVLVDIDSKKLAQAAGTLQSQYGAPVPVYNCDITEKNQVSQTFQEIQKTNGTLFGLINNAAINPKVEGNQLGSFRFENYPVETLLSEIQVGLVGAMHCVQAVIPIFRLARQGVIVNMSSDLGLISPDQRLYSKAGLSDQDQPVKPVSYSIIKSGLIGMTRYLATYLAAEGIRVNAVAPGGVYAGQPEEFVTQLSRLIPMGRMAKADEYRGTIAYLLSDASSYMTGATVVVDGGRTCW